MSAKSIYTFYENFCWSFHHLCFYRVNIDSTWAAIVIYRWRKQQSLCNVPGEEKLHVENYGSLKWWYPHSFFVHISFYDSVYACNFWKEQLVIIFSLVVERVFISADIFAQIQISYGYGMTLGENLNAWIIRLNDRLVAMPKTEIFSPMQRCKWALNVVTIN